MGGGANREIGRRGVRTCVRTWVREPVYENLCENLCEIGRESWCEICFALNRER